MKANFVLTPSTVHLFLNRLQKMLSITGILEVQHFYTGAKDRARLLKKYGIKNYFISCTIVKTVPSFIDEDTVRFDSYPSMQRIWTGEGVIVRINEDSSAVYYWGQKVRFTSNRIYLIGDDKETIRCLRRGGSLGIIRPYFDVAKAKRENHWQNVQSLAYWDEQDRMMDFY